MSFNSALSGLQAASMDLSVTSNNIANVATTGFKFSRTEFGDIYAVTPFGNSPTSVGNGVQIDRVSQQFSQGNLEFTDSSLDLAISGQGFFVVSQNLAGTRSKHVDFYAGLFLKVLPEDIGCFGIHRGVEYKLAFFLGHLFN